MAVAKWVAGKLYPTGSLVQPKTTVPPVPSQIPNRGFESGDTDWTKSNFTIVNQAGSFAGSWHAKFVYAGGATGAVKMTSTVPVIPGQSITASCQINPSGASDQVGAQIRLIWRDAANVIIGAGTAGNTISVPGSGYRMSSITDTAPANAAFAQVQGEAYSLQAAGVVLIDNFTWNYTPPAGTAGLIYKAVQPELGTSGSSEPTWPTTLGVQVIDNTVIWEAVAITRVTWEASPILLSGLVEPDWPTTVGASVVDNTIIWVTIPRQVTEAPNSKVVGIAAKKVFAADEDIIKFSATVDPLDWTSEDDAGYLPSGLNQYGSNDTEVINTYRGNLVSFSASTFQNWQVDPDPANMELLDAMEGVGSVFQQAAQPVANDLFYLAALGVRTVGIAAGTSNLSAGDAGQPIDLIIQAEIAQLATSGIVPLGLYFPALGQYWLAFGQNVYVYTMSQIGAVGAWSWYNFPWEIEATAQLGDYLYLRSGDAVYQIDTAKRDDEDADAESVEVVGEIISHYLDMGSPGITKMLIGFDIVGTGSPTVNVAYNQNDSGAKTTDFQVSGDTVPGQIIPIPVAGPSFAITLQYSSDDGEWEWLASNFYINDFRMGS